MTKPRKQIDYSSEFKKAWKLYPCGAKKLKSFEAYMNVPTSITETTILEGVKRYLGSREVQDHIKAGTTRFIPHFVTWLNGARWEDEPEPGTRIVPPIGDTMSRSFAQDVVYCILSGYNVQRGHGQFVEIVTSKPSGHIDMVALGGWGRREVLEISFHWRWPAKIGLKFVDTPRNGMTPDGLKHMSEYNAQLGALLRKAKG